MSGKRPLAELLLDRSERETVESSELDVYDEGLQSAIPNADFGTFTTRTLIPMFEDTETSVRQRAVSKQIEKQRNVMIQYAEMDESDRSSIEDGQEDQTFSNNASAVDNLLEHTVNNRLGPDMLLGLERGMCAWLQRTYLLFIAAGGLMQIENQASRFLGYTVAIACIVWIIYNYWLYFTRVGRLNRGEKIMYNENRRPTLFFILVLIATEISELIFQVIYDSGKRVTLVFVNPNQTRVVTPGGIDPGVVIGISFSAAILFSIAVSVVIYLIDVKKVGMFGRQRLTALV